MSSMKVVTWSLACCVGLSGAAVAQETGTRVWLQTVPASDPTHPSGLIQGDVWEFVGQAGDVVTIWVDTRDDQNEHTSTLDPVALLVRPDGGLAIWGDDESQCSRRPTCGYACPLVQDFTLDQTGRWTIFVQDFGGGTQTGRLCSGGAYNLSVTAPAPVLKTLSLRADDGGIQQPSADRRAVVKRKRARR